MTSTYALRAPLWEMVISETYYLTAVVSVWVELGLLHIKVFEAACVFNKSSADSGEALSITK